MTIHYHGLPITPQAVLQELAGRHFCVRHGRHEQVATAYRIGQSVMLDNGAYSRWKKNTPTDWPGYYAFCDEWLHFPTTWAVIPDIIGAPSQEQDGLLNEWPFKHRGAPVWHVSEPIVRLLRLCDEWPRVCVGSTDEYAEVLSPAWRRRMDEAFEEISQRHKRLPWLHMLRGMQLVRTPYPFASVDSTDVGRNHNRPQNTAIEMVRRWDARQCPGRWKPWRKLEAAQ